MKRPLAISVALLTFLAFPARAREGYVDMGTAFLMNDGGDMFTNRHVIEKCKPDAIFVRMADGRTSRATVKSVSKKYDLAALHTNVLQDEFASVRVNKDGFTMVPTPNEDVFAAGFSEPDKNGFKIQLRWGQTIGFVGKQDASSPINAVRVDVGHGASGSPVLDYGGILVGIIYASAGDVRHDPERLREFGYGDDVILMLNGNAIVDFANEAGLRINAWDKGANQDPMFVLGHLHSITAFVFCPEKA